ncbi:phosphoribosyltransferase family protein [Kitasatospora aureofaciens]|uniref:phosphoribosyltransferase family protein n=1 Tax=Kitasatospora aureofaciens TaxID=1894 RepID=UPI001FD5BCF7|nr:phosphoribosyltransferase family protein [Kitasatospora aureofaciens]
MLPRARTGLAGRQPVLVDDLVTTGASLAEAARALADAGLPARAAATVAATSVQPPV